MAVGPVVLLGKCRLYDYNKSDEKRKSILYFHLGILSPVKTARKRTRKMR